jgi:arylsulfatase A-like enzyme/GH43 family beta-xylosidase
MGYGDLGVTGNTKVPTPNMDRLAREGTRFTQFYVNSPICSPSRVALTTGMYPSRWRIHSYLNSRAQNAKRDMADWLDPAAPSLARALKEAGYATGHFGKWHMGGGRDVDDAPLITEYGFDESLTSFEGLGERYLWPDHLDSLSAQLGHGAIHWTQKSQMTRHYVDRAIDFMKRHADEPFFINLWPNDVHDEHRPIPELVAKYRGIAKSEDEAKFFAVLDEMDRQLGRFFDEMDRLGLSDETIVVLTGDNGPTDWPRYYRAGELPPGSTGGFRGRKWSLYEGGIREPLLVRWPGHVPAGRVDEETVLSSIDLVPSLAHIAGASFPSTARLDGEELSRAFFGTPARRERPLFWHYPNDIKPGNRSFLTPQFAMREGDWKVLAERDGSDAQLYDLARDPRETTDLAAAEPARTRRMADRLAAWAAELPLAPLPTFTNPIVTSQAAPDPWVIRHGDQYYFTATLDPEEGLWVWSSPTLTGLDHGRKVKVWDAPESGPMSSQIWAPELHFIDGRWYLYFTASDGVDRHHRHYVLEARTDDPQGEYSDPVPVDPGYHGYGIDGSVLQMPDGRLYFMYADDGIMIAPMSSPTRLAGPRIRIARGTRVWEHGWRQQNGKWVQGPGYWLEAPEALIHDGRIFVVYSAGHSATPHYYLGLLTLTGSDPLDPASWTKTPDPLFAPYEGPDGNVFTPGHNSFTRSPDGREDWLVYHAKDLPTGGFANRTTRIQPFTWKADGTPDFGHPIPAGVPIRKPSGE